MNQTAFNLVAISVFVMTLSALLGPLINLSPTIPALATFTILGIATFDSFSLQGKGGTIFIDWVAGFSPQYRDRIIHHEAGHFLVANLLGIPVTGYTLSAWEAWRQGQSGQGSISLNDTELGSQLEQGKISHQTLERYCTILMAGIAAETLVFERVEGGNDDRRKLANVFRLLGFSESVCQQKQRFHILQAKTLIQDNWLSYQALAEAIRQRATIADCQKAIADAQMETESKVA
ncbi:ATP-dependent Zn protease [Nostoc sp. NIES-2111]